MKAQTRRSFWGIWVLLLVFGASLSVLPLRAQAADAAAAKLPISVSVNGQSAPDKLTDGSYSTTTALSAGTEITISAADQSGRLYGLSLIWARRPETWELTWGDASLTCGQNSFLHEYVPIEGGAHQVTMTLSGAEELCYITAYGAGRLPDDVQVWEPECDRADILLFSTHADDEILFFGGVLPDYAGERGLKVQLVYFSNYFLGEVVREHEKLDGLWAAGVRQYPVNSPYPDHYSGSLEQARQIYGWDVPFAFLMEQIRRFKPQICIAQDTNGEYGHGTHMLTSLLMQEAVKVSMDPTVCPGSAETYGVWDVPKTYIHLYGENRIMLDCRRPLSAFGGQTALEVATAAYKKHVSQQWCWFYVSDTYEYSIAEYGMCRSTVGADTGSDMMEHLLSYEEQDRIEAERRAEAERLEREEAERKAQEEAERRAQEEAERLEREQAEQEAQERAERQGVRRQLMLLVLALLLLAAGIAVALVTLRQNSRRRRRRRR